ncbi:MAG: hypothetical protein N2506_04000 [Dehalococcoidales bacterium]|nr:hypothetical protein [Dehalococcoidales bacterium]
MKKAIMRILGLGIIVSLVLMLFPALPVFAENDIDLSPTQGAVGATVTVTGENFDDYVPTATYDYYAVIYFAKDSTSLGRTLTAYVDTYKLVTESTDPIDTDGSFEASFHVPSALTDGSDDEDVTEGTYYVYVTLRRYNNNTGDETYMNTIRAKATFTVTGSASISLSPSSGAAGSDVTINGTSFPASSSLTFKFDGSTVSRKSGSSSTSSTGTFSSVITVPSTASAGSHTISVTAGSVTREATFTVTASAVLDPLSPSSGTAGTDVTVSGANFPASTALTFKFDTQTITPKSGDTSTRASGTFLTTITIPQNATAGAHPIPVTAGTASASATFTVTASPEVSITPSSGTAGTDVTVSGAHFPASTALTFKFDTQTVTPKSGDAITNAQGGFNSVLTIPQNAAAGVHSISVTAGTSTVAVSFTVVATTPTPTATTPTTTTTTTPTATTPRPSVTKPPVTPEIGAKERLPVDFDWTDVVSANPPVTYTLQIATDKNFTPGSIILEKKGLTQSAYTLSEMDIPNLATQATYYWRVKASDTVAQDIWTTSGEFYLAPPFRFPTWAIYAGAVAGGIIIFLLGFWVGRRTAFYY